jgi:hypothetical protein
LAIADQLRNLTQPNICVGNKTGALLIVIRRESDAADAAPVAVLRVLFILQEQDLK